jgi:hypothetical protein
MTGIYCENHSKAHIYYAANAQFITVTQKWYVYLPLDFKHLKRVSKQGSFT